MLEAAFPSPDPDSVRTHLFEMRAEAVTSSVRWGRGAARHTATARTKPGRQCSLIEALPWGTWAENVLI